MGAGGMIDAVAAAARGAPLKANQLRQQSCVVEQVELARINERQQVAIQFRLRLGGGLVGDAVTAEALARPVAAVAVAIDLGDAIEGWSGTPRNLRLNARRGAFERRAAIRFFEMD
jgi:hypothetical protein